MAWEHSSSKDRQTDPIGKPMSQTTLRTQWDTFVARPLLSTDTGNRTVVISVAHGAFLSAWPHWPRRLPQT
jgi:hypothetical protein